MNTSALAMLIAAGLLLAGGSARADINLTGFDARTTVAIGLVGDRYKIVEHNRDTGACRDTNIGTVWNGLEHFNTFFSARNHNDSIVIIGPGASTELCGFAIGPMDAGNGRIWIDGNGGNDILISDATVGALDGGSGSDILLHRYGLSTGGSGNDIVLTRSTGSENPFSIGGAGDDLLCAYDGFVWLADGEDGNDIFVGTAQVTEDVEQVNPQGGDTLCGYGVLHMVLLFGQN